MRISDWSSGVCSSDLVDFITMGQYLQPTPKHANVEEFVTPAAFNAYGSIARAKRFLHVASCPLTRSSYHTGEDFAPMRAARVEKQTGGPSCRDRGWTAVYIPVDAVALQNKRS